LVARTRRYEGWRAHVARNDWFQARVTRALGADGALAGTPGVLFAHSYSAREIFRGARARNWMTVLGQIDPGPEHFRIADALAQRLPEFGPAPTRPPDSYFDAWREECELADCIVVNSEWSATALTAAGVPPQKLRLMPLAFEPAAGTVTALARRYPASFSPSRPLRALFVGTASVAKGVADVLQAIELLPGQPIELHLVGDRRLVLPRRFVRHPAIRWHGRLTRHAVLAEYQAADVLLFPSHSDGFGMAQVEAQAWGLPIIASRHCGQVVIDGETGFLLDEVSPQAIAGALGKVLAQPRLVARFAEASAATRRPGLAALSSVLAALSPR
jgi:glycosyltransferase involved in cell wall biosynthesis